MNIKLAKPIGPCFGVLKAIEKVKQIAKQYKGKNIYLLGQVVHNDQINEDLEKEGVTVINYNINNIYKILDDFKMNDIVIFSAHGHKKEWEDILKDKGVLTFDTTCEKVKHSFDLIKGMDEVIYIGKEFHPESYAALSMNENIRFYNVDKPFDYSLVKTKNPKVVNQTTLSFLDLKHIHEEILHHIEGAKIEDAICDAVYVRQKNIVDIDEDIDLILVIGNKKSSNTTRLVELARLNHPNKTTLLIESVDDLSQIGTNYRNCLITSGTSTPIESVLEIAKQLERGTTI